MKRWVIPVVAVVLLLGVGFATYFLGGLGSKPATPGEPVRIDPSMEGAGSLRPRELLRLKWGSGPKDASRRGTPVRSTMEAAFVSAGRIFVVDHPVGVFGARVRWFSASGELLGVHNAPGGSTNFGPCTGGFDYVIAKSGGPSERAVVYDVSNETSSAFVVPMGLNSGPLFWQGNTLFASTIINDVDLTNEKVVTRGSLVPVAVDGAQMDDAQAEAGILPGWGVGLDGRVYDVTTRIDGVTSLTSKSETVLTLGDVPVLVPEGRRVLGVDAASRAYLVAQVRIPMGTDRQPSAGWPSGAEPFADVVVADTAGRIRSAAAIPRSALVDWRAGDAVDFPPLALCAEGVVTVVESKGGVSIVIYEDR